MCGRFTQTFAVDYLAGFFKLAQMPDELPPRYNIAPTQNVPVIVLADQRKLVMMRWGLIPAWAQDKSIGQRMINARSETLNQKPAFRTALKKRRCLVVADGFYEWAKLGTKKQPIYVRLQSREPFGFAGLWETWRTPENEEIKSTTIVTCPANDLIQSFHPRMPVILPREHHDRWLDPKLSDAAALLPLLKPFPAEGMEAYAISAIGPFKGGEKLSLSSQQLGLMALQEDRK